MSILPHFTITIQLSKQHFSSLLIHSISQIKQFNLQVFTYDILISLFDFRLNYYKGVKKNFRLYTKTFGGKIWTDLHRVSPGNFSAKKLKGIRLQISRQNTRNNNPCKKVFLKPAHFPPYNKNFQLFARDNVFST